MSPPLTTEAFLEELKLRARMTDEYILASAERLEFGPEHISKGVLSYIRGRGKRLRPAILLFSCGAAGGCESDALPAAAAVELFHTWTLDRKSVV